MTIAGLVLDDFAPITAKTNEPSEAFTQGMTQGYEQAQEEFKANQAALSDELINTLADMAFTYAEARQEILNGLRPVVQAMIEQLVPHMAEQGLTSRLADQINDACKDHTPNLCVHIHPDNVQTIQSDTGASQFSNLTLVPDESLSRCAAQWSSDGHETLIDLAPLCDQISDVFETIFTERAQSHG